MKEEVDTEEWRLWVAPGAARAQMQIGDRDIDVRFKGSIWWSTGWAEEPTSNLSQPNGEHGKGPGASLINTGTYGSRLHISDVSESSFIGRDALIVRAVPSWDETEPPEQNELYELLACDPDELVVTIDSERGVLLRSEESIDGVVYRIVEMTSVEFDIEIPDAVFTLGMPTG
jgi:hypothetical protein